MGVRRSSLTAAAVLGVGWTAIGGGWTAAQATPGHTLFVNNGNAHCSDTTVDSSATPYCTIKAAAAAVQAGEDVEIAGGTYPDPVTVTAAGTAAEPITIEAAPGAAVTIGGSSYPVPQVSGVVTVQHAQYVTIKGLNVWDFSPESILVSGSDHVTLDRVNPFWGTIHVTGSTNTVVRGTVSNGSSAFGETAILVDDGSSGTVVADNAIYQASRSIRVHGATNTAVTGNTIVLSCASGIEVDGGSTGTTVENNVLTGNDQVEYPGVDSSQCGNGTPVDPDTGGIAVDGTATVGTRVDYNVVWPGLAKDMLNTPVLYRWGSAAYTDLKQFQTQNPAQAAHDLEADPLVETGYLPQFLHLREGSPAIDSADSTAPGEQTTDAFGAARVDDPTVPNTGAPAGSFYDRGAIEFQDPFTVTATATTNGLTTVTVNASTTGWKPATSYTFDFGGGDTVTQASATIAHDVAMPTSPGSRTVGVTVHATEQDTGTVAVSTPVLANFGYANPTVVAKTSVAWSQEEHSYQLTVDASGSTPGSTPIAGYSFIIEDQHGNRFATSGRQVSPVFTASVPDGTTVVAQVSAWDTLGGEGSAYTSAVPIGFPPPPASSIIVDRLAGADRYATGVAVSQRQWADSHAGTTGRTQAKAVVLATGEGFADAVTGVPLAAHVGGPLLLTEPNRLTPETEQEITRILPAQPGSTVYLLGGTRALSQGVADRLAALGYHVQRLEGADRYATARAIAHQLGDPTRVIVATGHNYADALTAGPLAAKHGAAILLSDGPSLDGETAAYVRRSLAAPTTGSIDTTGLTTNVVAVGGDGGRAVQAIAGGAPWRELSGTDRYNTAATVAREFSAGAGSVHTIGVATGEGFPDALTGGALMATLGNPLLLTMPDQTPTMLPGSVQPSIWQELSEVVLFGGTHAISQSVEDQIAGFVGGVER